MTYFKYQNIQHKKKNYQTHKKYYLYKFLKKGVNFMFGKKKESNILNFMYYEGLQGFIQDFPCTITLEADALIIRKIMPDLTVKLPLNQVLAIDTLPEQNFLVQYHNTTGTTAKMGTKFYYVFKYTSSTGEPKHIAFWDVSAKTMKQVLNFRELIAQQGTPSEYVL